MIYFEILLTTINAIELEITIFSSIYLHMKLRENDIIVISKSLDKGFMTRLKWFDTSYFVRAPP